jgi:hypothetical protein
MLAGIAEGKVSDLDTAGSVTPTAASLGIGSQDGAAFSSKEDMAPPKRLPERLEKQIDSNCEDLTGTARSDVEMNGN